MSRVSRDVPPDFRGPTMPALDARLARSIGGAAPASPPRAPRPGGDPPESDAQ